MSVQSMLDDSCTLRRPALTAGSFGGVTETLSAHASGVATRIRPLTLAERSALSRDMMVVSHRMYFESDTDVHHGDSILMATTSPLSSVSLDVGPTNDRGMFLQVDVMQRQ